jgi:hypothetical protein
MTTNGNQRLGSWTRIGIVLSVLWVLGAGGATLLFPAFILLAIPRVTWPYVAIVAFAPLSFFWLIAWVIRATYRWVRRGFDVPPSPQS